MKGACANLWHRIKVSGVLVAGVSIDLADGITQKLGNLVLKSSSERMGELERRDWTRSKDERHWLIQEEADVVESLASMIVPSSEESPGAKEINVMGPSVVEILDSWIAKASNKRLIYSLGLVAFD